jgi:molybdate transport system substrate-binding protein
VDLVRSGVGIAVPAGSTRPDVSSEAAVRGAVLAARSVGFSTGPSGTHLQKLFERWGILEQIRDRIVIPRPGIPVGSLVASGEVDLGFQQLSELINVEGIQVLGPLPAAIQTLTVFSASVAATSQQAGAAGALVEHLASATTADIKRRHGMEPMA